MLCNMDTKKTAIITAIAALLLLGVWMLGSKQIGADGPCGLLGWIGVVLSVPLIPACMIGSCLGAASSLAVPVFSFLELFLFVWIVLRLVYGRCPT